MKTPQTYYFGVASEIGCPAQDDCRGAAGIVFKSRWPQKQALVNRGLRGSQKRNARETPDD
jgi:hypothetical protein